MKVGRGSCKSGGTARGRHTSACTEPQSLSDFYPYSSKYHAIRESREVSTLDFYIKSL